MEKILWIGSPFFSGSLEECGWTAHAHNFEDARHYSWADLVELAGFEPDVLVVADKSRAPFVLGMENFPCFTVFYAVDSHIHSWESMYAQAFDACLVSLHDHLGRFSGPYLSSDRIWWSPPFAKDCDQPAPDADDSWDCLFVGSNDPRLMPDRYQFLQELSQRVPGLRVMKGDYKSLFSHAKVLINQAGKGDLNFRVFEAMGCGGCLVTPRIGNGQDQLFVDGEHLVQYAPGDAGDAAYRIQFLLDHPELREHIRQTALEEVNSKHRAIHRAQALTDHLCDLAIMGTEDIVARRRDCRSIISFP